jgi:hypothetical protein
VDVCNVGVRAQTAAGEVLQVLLLRDGTEQTAAVRAWRGLSWQSGIS